jgi:hypothetical protein
MWRAGSVSGGAAPASSSSGSKMRASAGSWSSTARGSPPSSPFKKGTGATLPIPGRGDVKVYGADSYKYPYEKDSSG